MHSKFAPFCALLLVPLTAPTAAQVPPVDYAYRADSRHPDAVFAQGFRAIGHAVDVIAHAAGGTCHVSDPQLASAWVSTSANVHQARLFAESWLRMVEVDGWTETMWMYRMRPDNTFHSVPWLVEQVLSLSNNNQMGYSRSFAASLISIRDASSIGFMEEVIAREVLPANIIDATPYWYSNGQLVTGPAYTNPAYLPLNTHDNRELPPNINALIPPDSMRASTRAASCAQSCDAASAPFDSSLDASEKAMHCRLWSGWVTPSLRAALF